MFFFLWRADFIILARSFYFDLLLLLLPSFLAPSKWVRIRITVHDNNNKKKVSILPQSSEAILVARPEKAGRAAGFSSQHIFIKPINVVFAGSVLSSAGTSG